MKRVAIVGAGIAGLAAARQLHQSGRAAVTLFEASAGFGGHARTVDLTVGGVSAGVDTGFLVFNHATYPRLTALFAQLGIATPASDMSFSVQLPQQGLEWSGHSLRSVFAQARNLARPRFWRMLAEIARFNRIATRLVEQGRDTLLAQTVEDFLDQHGFGEEFRAWYFLPMVGCIWSCPAAQMLAFPVGTLLRFCHNHGLLRVADRPQWRTVAGGSREYVRRIVAELPDARSRTPVLAVQRHGAGAFVKTAAGTEHFDAVVLACHTDQALRLLGDDATPMERRLLGAIRYQRNRTVLHTDASLLPSRRAAWAAWNYEAAPAPDADRVCLHYLINRLQPLPWAGPVIVSLNPLRPPRDAIDEWEVDHPVFDHAAIAAQQRLPVLQGARHTWFCGAWAGYGFHEDGLTSGLAAAQGVLAEPAQALRGAA
jgi:predicted NAD/FAD-binding protein